MVDVTAQIIERLGYLGAGLLMLIETIIPPIPSEVIMPLVGLAAAKGDLSLIGVTAAAIMGATAGATAWYALARAYGPARLLDLADRHGKWLGLSRGLVERATNWLAARGGWAIFLARILPGMRVYISVPAGIAGMPFPRFLLYTAAGYTVWYGLLGIVGYALGANITLITHLLAGAAPYLYAAFAAWVGWRLIAARRSRKG